MAHILTLEKDEMCTNKSNVSLVKKKVAAPVPLAAISSDMFSFNLTKIA